MKRAIILAVTALLAAAGTTHRAGAQQSYSYEVTRTRNVNIPIDWQPDERTHRRYTVSVSPLRLLSNGLKFDFEVELPKPGNWFGTSLTVYLAPERKDPDPRNYWYDDHGNNRSTGLLWSDYNSYSRMWGLGTSAIYKNTFSRRGWYYAAGITLEFFRVGVGGSDYIPYEEDGLTFYDYSRTLKTRSYFKPKAQIVVGKHMALSERCYFDLYAGIGLSHGFVQYGYDYSFSGVGGFAHRGFTPVGGFRFGVLLWKPIKPEN